MSDNGWGSAPGDRDDSAFLDRLYSALAHSHRRWLLATLRMEDEPIAMADLARTVAASEADVSQSEVSADTAQRVYLELHHNHLPRLAEINAVTINSDHNTVEKGDNFQAAVSLLDTVATAIE